MNPEEHWKIIVTGSLVWAGTEDPVYPAQAILESGSRDEASPHCLLGVGPIAHTNSKGAFHSWYIVRGSANGISNPQTVSVFLKVARGNWKPYIVPVVGFSCGSMSEREVAIELGPVEIEQGQEVFASEV